MKIKIKNTDENNTITFMQPFKKGSAVKLMFLLLSMLLSINLMAQEIMPLPEFSSSFTGNARGYWFTAPEDFTITSLKVPDDIGNAPQTIEFIRFNNGPPPFWNETTDDFTSLFRVDGYTGTGAVSAVIQVSAGDHVGVMGSRDDLSSYGMNNFESQIGASTVTLTRMGMQAFLSNSVASDIWQETTSSIARVEISYLLGSLFEVGGSVEGLEGVLELQNNAGDTLVINGNGPFAFESLLDSGSIYDVTITPQSGNETCTVINGIGTIGSENVTDIQVSCGSMNMPLPEFSSSFTGNARGYWFTAPEDFTITSLKVPDDIGNAPQTIEFVRFNNGPPPFWNETTDDFTSLFRVDGYTGTGAVSAVIQVSAGDHVGVMGSRDDLSSYGMNNFESQIGGNTVTLTRMGMQAFLSNSVASDLWQETTSSIARVEISYLLGSLFEVGGSVEGLVGVLELQNNAGDLLVVNEDGLFAFEGLLDSGTVYDVSVVSQPVDQICTVTDGMGILTNSNVGDIQVNCGPISYFVAGSVGGLIPDNFMVLQNNSGNDLVLTEEGDFIFSTSVNNNESYEVTIRIQPDDPIQNCQVLNGMGIIQGADVVDVVIDCEFGNDLIYRHGFDTIDAINRAYWQPED